jgi:hypothetical protein
MKKLILVLAIALMAVPAMALDVYMTNSGTTLTVAYKNADPANLPRAFALKIVLDGTGTFNLNGISGFKTGESVSTTKGGTPGYGIFPARINIASTGTVNSYGNPLADSNDAGATGTGLGTNTVVLEFGSLYYGDVNAPATSGTLCSLTFTKGTATKATLSTEATYRGGIVLEDGTAVTDSNEVVFVTDCLSPSATEYNKWVDYGKPDCWCFRKQCRGDADGAKTLTKPVMSPDLTIFKAAFNKSKADVKLVVSGGKPGICADFDHKDTLTKPVMSPDLTIFKEYFNDADGSVPQCDAAPIITGPYNSWKN